jgi:hypothetical protein
MKISLAVITGLLALIGCEKVTEGTVDPHGFPPFVSRALVRPDTIKMTTLVEQNGLLSVSVVARMKVNSAAETGPLSSVMAELLTASGNTPILSLALADNGIAPDSTKGDSVYSGTLQFTIPKSASGRYRVRFSATNTDGLSSNLLEQPLYMIRNNSAPTLSNLQAPDTVTVIVGSFADIKLAVKVVDLDGQSDIKEVFFRSLDSSDPTRKYPMKDDGSPDGVSGDAVAGDSIYTIVVRVTDGHSVRQTYRFAYQASDAFGDTSATLLHRLTIR